MLDLTKMSEELCGMLKINKISSFSAVDYAAEELRKYLRMMMPECGNVEISYNPSAKDGFRLGLIQDFGLDVSDVEEPDLDDILYIDTDTEGGVIAGDNPRSVLLSVYEYLRKNGCRFLMPGVDGEFVPMQDIKPVKYRHVPTSRYRGWGSEGFMFQENLYDAIEFMPKVGMNLFMIEFLCPTEYYRRHYEHRHNQKNRPPEPITPAQILQWKRGAEAEIFRRGIMYHDVGHGWTTGPFGIDTNMDRVSPEENDKKITDEQRQYLAMVDGRRGLWRGIPTHTQFCMSNKKARELVAKGVADYAENHKSDYIHVWLADSRFNHCECENCQKKIPSDWYVMLLNEIDEALADRNLDTRIVYIAYTETFWAPEVERLKNPKRFALLFAPSSRKYSEALKITDCNPKVTPYNRNKNTEFKEINELFAHFRDWTKDWHGANLAFEYHFWRHQSYDVGGIELSKIIYDDVKFYEENNIHGVIEDGSQRCFFPTGLAFYVYARTLFDSSVSFESIVEDYFKTAFGEDWRDFYNYLERLGKAFSLDYLTGDKNRGTGRSDWYAPERVSTLKSVRGIIKEGRELICAHYNSDYRIRTVSARLLEFHAKYAEMFADVLIEKAAGNDGAAYAKFEEMRDECGKYEIQFENYYDHGLIFNYASVKVSAKTVTAIDAVED